MGTRGCAITTTRREVLDGAHGEGCNHNETGVDAPSEVNGVAADFEEEFVEVVLSPNGMESGDHEGERDMGTTGVEGPEHEPADGREYSSWRDRTYVMIHEVLPDHFVSYALSQAGSFVLGWNKELSNTKKDSPYT